MSFLFSLFSVYPNLTFNLPDKGRFILSFSSFLPIIIYSCSLDLSTELLLFELFLFIFKLLFFTPKEIFEDNGR